MRHRALLPLSFLFTLAAAIPALSQTPGGGDDAKIASALSAGPPSLTENAAVMDWPSADGAAMSELRPGTNGWACMPDVPSTPGEDPMCLDATFQTWAEAWQGRTAPAITSPGLAYMLVGGTDASNTDPYATEPASDEDWVKSGPHVMVVLPDPAQLEGLSTDPDNGGPWVMWKGTPYAHIMMPIGHAKGHGMHEEHEMEKMGEAKHEMGEKDRKDKEEMPKEE